MHLTLHTPLTEGQLYFLGQFHSSDHFPLREVNQIFGIHMSETLMPQISAVFTGCTCLFCYR